MASSTTYNPAKPATAQTETQPPMLLRVQEFAKLAAVSKRSAYRLIESGEVRAVRLGGALRARVVRSCRRQSTAHVAKAWPTNAAGRATSRR